MIKWTSLWFSNIDQNNVAVAAVRVCNRVCLHCKTSMILIDIYNTLRQRRYTPFNDSCRKTELVNMGRNRLRQWIHVFIFPCWRKLKCTCNLVTLGLFRPLQYPKHYGWHGKRNDRLGNINVSCFRKLKRPNAWNNIVLSFSFQNFWRIWGCCTPYSSIMLAVHLLLPNVLSTLAHSNGCSQYPFQGMIPVRSVPHDGGCEHL